VTSIGSSAFFYCTSLTSVTIPASVTTIGSSAFYYCTGLTSVTIPVGVTSIGSLAFYYCTRLASVSIPAGVTSIGGSAFYYCTGLMSVSVPSTVTSIGSSAFSRCTSLLAITVDSANAAYASVDGVLYNKLVSALIQCPAGKTGSVVIPSTVTSIGGSAFYYCTVLTNVTIPSGVASIGSSAFYYCTGLTSVTIPTGVTSIGSSAFSQCYALRSMYFFASPPSLGASAFSRSPLTVYRLSDANGWSSTYGGAPVQIFQPIEVAAGQKVTVSVGASVDRVVKKGAGTAILTTASARTGGTVVEAGELVVRQKDALGTGLLEVQAGARATFQTGYDTVAVTSLALASTARIELGTSKLTVAANGFNESDIRSKLIAGRNGGSWDGTSGITSTFAGGDRAIGYRVADGALEVAYAAPGDSNLDGVIDILDIGDILAAGKFNTGEPANWVQGDTNYDNVFDIVDLADILGTNLFNEGTYLTQSSASSAAVETGGVATFDPALVFAALAMDSSTQTTTKRKSF